MKTQEYLGDGLYAEFDGYQLILKANSHEYSALPRGAYCPSLLSNMSIGD